eukprot:scaffold4252_cov22-Tisochrysis_lutea.AAC.3
MLSKAHPAAIASLSLFCLLPLLLPTPQIDLFGEISGISFTPLGEELFVGVADLTYSSMLQLTLWLLKGKSIRPRASGPLPGYSCTPIPCCLFGHELGLTPLYQPVTLEASCKGPASGMGSCQDVPLQWDRQSEADEQDEQDGEVEVSDMEDEEELRWQQLQQSLREEEEQEELDRQQRMEQIDDR